jgi:hypothetical protein
MLASGIMIMPIYQVVQAILKGPEMRHRCFMVQFQVTLSHQLVGETLPFPYLDIQVGPHHIAVVV